MRSAAGALLATLCLTLPALAQNYQPLAERDKRTYARDDAFGAIQMEPTEVTRDADPWYQFDSYLGMQDLWVAYHQNSIYAWDSATQRVVQLFDFNAQVGSVYTVEISGQQGPGMMSLAASDETVSVGAGTFSDCYRFRYRAPGVADTGWLSIWIAPDVGIVKWSENSFAGPINHTLETAEIGGVVYPQPVPTGGLAVSLEATQYNYTWNPMAPVALPIYGYVTFTVDNATGQPIDVTYNSGQRFDIQLIDVATGQVEWVWSANKAFTQVISFEQINGTVQISESVPFPYDGEFQVKMWLTTANKRFEASTTIRLTAVSTP